MTFRAFLRRSASFAVALAVTSPAWSVQCTDDTPPTADGEYVCDNYATCPVTAEPGGTRYRGGKIVHFGVQNVGACDTPRAYTGIRCEDPRATCTTPSGGGTQFCKIDYLGLVYKPSTTMPAAGYPAVMLVTGSSECSPSFPATCVYQPSVYCGFTAALLAKGYVVFQPLPRGYGIDPTTKSSGLYVSDLVTKQVFRNDGCAFNNPSYPQPACSALDLEDEGHQDVKDGFLYMKNLAYVDKTKVAAFGYSFGAIRVIALNELALGQSAVVAAAAGSESWCRFDGTNNMVLINQLLTDTSSGRSPTYFFQTQNDVNLESTAELSHRAGAMKKQFQATLFPKAKDLSGTPYPFGDQAHGCFSADQHSVNLWAPQVIDFLARYGVK